jgi:hypothetical protein
MADGSADSRVYFTFCRLNRLSFDDPRSWLQFCMRMRAAWLRVVGGYPYTKGKAASSEDAIIAYMKNQNICEIQLQHDDKRHIESVYTKQYEILSHPENYTRQQLRDSMPDHRVLVYGAPMRCAGAAANPYLCHSSLQ